MSLTETSIFDDTPIGGAGEGAGGMDAFTASVYNEFLNHVGRAPTDQELSAWKADRAPGDMQALSQRTSILPVSAEANMSLGSVLKGAFTGFLAGGPAGAIGGGILGALPTGPRTLPAPTGFVGSGGLPGVLLDIDTMLGNDPNKDVIARSIVQRLAGRGLTSGGGIVPTQGGGLPTKTTGGGVGAPTAGQGAGGIVFQPGKGWVLRRTYTKVQTIDRRGHIDKNGNFSLNAPRMNVLNPQALARAYRRMTGFAHVAKKGLQAFGFHVSGHAKLKSGKSKRRR